MVQWYEWMQYAYARKMIEQWKSWITCIYECLWNCVYHNYGELILDIRDKKAYVLDQEESDMCGRNEETMNEKNLTEKENDRWGLDRWVAECSGMEIIKVGLLMHG